MLKLVPVIVEPSSVSFFSGNGRNCPNDHCGLSPVAYYLPTPVHHIDHCRRPSCSPHSHNLHNRPYGTPLTQCVWTFFWLALLLVIGYPVGMIASQLYLLASPLIELFGADCVWAQRGVGEPLLRAMHLPLICARNMATAKPLIFI